MGAQIKTIIHEGAYGLFTDFNRIWGRRLTDCLRIFTSFGGGLGEKGLRIVYGLGLDLGEEAYGFGAGGVWVLEP